MGGGVVTGSDVVPSEPGRGFGDLRFPWWDGLWRVADPGGPQRPDARRGGPDGDCLPSLLTGCQEGGAVLVSGRPEPVCSHDPAEESRSTPSGAPGGDEAAHAGCPGWAERRARMGCPPSTLAGAVSSSVVLRHTEGYRFVLTVPHHLDHGRNGILVVTRHHERVRLVLAQRQPGLPGTSSPGTLPPRGCSQRGQPPG